MIESPLGCAANDPVTMKWLLVAVLLLAVPLAGQARGCRVHVHRSHRWHRISRPPLQALVYSGQSATELLEMDGLYTRDSLVKGLRLALAAEGNRMLPCVLDFHQVMHEGGYARFLAEWEPAAREELLVYLQQLECEDTLRMTREVLAQANPSQEALAEASRQLLDDGEDLGDALCDYCFDHRGSTP